MYGTSQQAIARSRQNVKRVANDKVRTDTSGVWKLGILAMRMAAFSVELPMKLSIRATSIAQGLTLKFASISSFLTWYKILIVRSVALP